MIASAADVRRQASTPVDDDREHGECSATNGEFMDDSARKKFAPLVLRAAKLLLDQKAAVAVLARSKRKAAPKARKPARVPRGR